MKNFFFLTIGLVIVIGSIFLFLRQEVPADKSIGVVKIATTTINVELANTHELRVRGLSGRSALANGSGMLFVFDHPDKYGIWMKDMNFPIDIVWISEFERVVHIEREVSPATYPEIFEPNELAKYVLELPAGFAKKHGIDIGAQVYLE